jgi:excinuclease ABC subunit A
MIKEIRVQGARQHNLKNIDVRVPREHLTVITGLSGSGKSSLAFDTIYAEGQRRYIESLSTYARQFLEQMEKPDVDIIEGLSPAISIEQKTTSRSPRSTVGTVTEIYDYLRVLFSAVGIPHCPQCHKPISRQSIDRIVDDVLSMPLGQRVMVLAPVVRGRKGEFRKQFESYLKKGYLRARVDGKMVSLEESISLDKRKNHSVEVVVDRLLIKEDVRRRLELSIRAAAGLTEGLVTIAVVDGPEETYSERSACIDCGISLPEMEPRSFSFNSRYGACETCQGLGVQQQLNTEAVVANPEASLERLRFHTENPVVEHYLRESLDLLARNFKLPKETSFLQLPQEIRQIYFFGSGKSMKLQYGRFTYEGVFHGVNKWLRQRLEGSTGGRLQEDLAKFFSESPCPACAGRRLKPESLAVKVEGRSISEYAQMPISTALQVFLSMRPKQREQRIAGQLLKEIRSRLQFLIDVGVAYLSLDRGAGTLSGGESQRIRLATQIGSQLRGVLYVLDEPSIGLHPRDNRRLLDSLMRLRNMGNTIIVVEHDEETIRHADYVIDLGPGAGSAGGELVAAGSVEDIAAAPGSRTGRFLSGEERIELPAARRQGNGKVIEIGGAAQNNLKDLDVRFPLGMLIGVTGVSGSGKSSLVDEILYRALARKLYRALDRPGKHRDIAGIENIDKVVEIDQSPIGRTPRSNPATYAGLFTPIRELFSMLPESRIRGYSPGRFSFNVKGGRCEVCEGDGLRKIEMSFLPDVYVLCETCRGSRYQRETLSVKYNGHSIADVLNMTISDALVLLENVPTISAKLKTLIDVGLGYICLGQSATTLSGGEAQRVKLARELSRRATGRTLYILDEPTTGLHFEDVRKLLDILSRLVDLGNTVIVIEHNLDVIKTADWIIDLGPEGGEEGGYLVACGSPEQVSRVKNSFTGQALRAVLEKSARINPRHREP